MLQNICPLHTVGQGLSGQKPLNLLPCHFNPPGNRLSGAEPRDLNTLLEEADIVSLHARSKERLIGSEELARMKPSALLINTARGDLVDYELWAKETLTVSVLLAPPLPPGAPEVPPGVPLPLPLPLG